MGMHMAAKVPVIRVSKRALSRPEYMQTAPGRRLRISLRLSFLISVIVAVSAGIFIRHSVLDAGFFSDDLDHYAMRHGVYPVSRSHFDMFNFSDGSAAENRALMQAGHFPWWTFPTVHLSMWRPLSSGLMAFDFAMFGSNARLFHVHSLMWWALLVIAVGTVLWQVQPKLTAAVALLLFALEEGHGLPVAWPANRSTLVASAFGFFALALLIRWRNTGHRRARFGFVVFSILALAAGEYAFTAFAYLAAYELLRPQATRVSVVHALWPVVAAAGVYLVLRQALGYGIEGSGFYISPTGTPFAFLTALSWRAPVLAGDLLFGVPADWYVLGTPWRERILDWNLFSPQVWYALPGWHAVQIGIGVLGLALLALLVWRLPRLLDEARARTLRWLLAGALLSLVPVAGTMVSSRLTVAASVGFDALYGELIVACATWLLTRSLPVRWRAIAAVSCGLLLWVHVYHSADRSYEEASWYAFHSDLERDWILTADLDERQVAKQDLIVFAAQDVMTTWYIPYLRLFVGRPPPRSAWILSGAPQAHDLTRVAPNAFELSVLTSDVERMAAGSNYRPLDAPMHVGDEVQLDGIQVKVLSALHGQPARALFTFDEPLESARYVFLHPTERGLRRVHLPAVGERIRLRRPVYPSKDALSAVRFDREQSVRDGHGGALAPMDFELFRP
jgi:hypothetical protein